MARQARACVAVALMHWPVLNRKGETSATAVTPMDVHDFARSCAFFGIAPIYIVHPAQAMRDLVQEMLAHWLHGPGRQRNPSRAQALSEVRVAGTLEDVCRGQDYRLWYTSAQPPSASTMDVACLPGMPGKHLIVFGTGHGLDASRLPAPSGWLSPIDGGGIVRHLSVRAALAIYLDRLARSEASMLEA